MTERKRDMKYTARKYKKRNLITQPKRKTPLRSGYFRGRGTKEENRRAQMYEREEGRKLPQRVRGAFPTHRLCDFPRCEM